MIGVGSVITNQNTDQAKADNQQKVTIIEDIFQNNTMKQSGDIVNKTPALITNIQPPELAKAPQKTDQTPEESKQTNEIQSKKTDSNQPELEIVTNESVFSLDTITTGLKHQKLRDKNCTVLQTIYPNTIFEVAKTTSYDRVFCSLNGFNYQMIKIISTKTNEDMGYIEASLVSEISNQPTPKVLSFSKKALIVTDRTDSNITFGEGDCVTKETLTNCSSSFTLKYSTKPLPFAFKQFDLFTISADYVQKSGTQNTITKTNELSLISTKFTRNLKEKSYAKINTARESYRNAKCLEAGTTNANKLVYIHSLTSQKIQCDVSGVVLEFALVRINGLADNIYLPTDSLVLINKIN